MANPLSERGFTDRDYSALVGTLVGEAAVKGGIQDYQAIADVVANRVADPAFSKQYGPSIAAQTMNAKEFSAWSANEKNANYNARAGFAASLNPKVASSLPAAVQERISLAQQAVDDVFNTGKARGITQGATFYDNPEVTAKLGTGGFHNRLDSKYGSVVIGDHRFTGPTFDPTRPFDPITYNGMLGIPDAAEIDLSGVAFNDNRLDDNSTQIDPVPSGSVDYMGTLADPRAPSIDMGNYGEAPFGIGSIGPAGWADMAGMTPEWSPAAMDMGTFNDIQNAGAFGMSGIDPLGPSLDGYSREAMPGQAYGSGALGFAAPSGMTAGDYISQQAQNIAGVETTPYGSVAPTEASFLSSSATYSPGGIGAPPSGYTSFDASPFGFGQPTQDIQVADIPGLGAAPAAFSPSVTNDAVRQNTTAVTPSATPSTAEFVGPMPSVPATPAPVENPFDMQAMYAGDMEDKLGTQRGPFATTQAVPQVAKNVAAPSVTNKPAVPQVAPQLPALGAPVAINAAPLSSSFEAANPYGGFGSPTDAMNAIGSGQASLPEGYNSAWGKTAFGDSVYAGAAYNDLMDTVAPGARKGIVEGLLGDMGIKAPSFGSLNIGNLLGGLFGGGVDMSPVGESSYGGYTTGGFDASNLGAQMDAFMGGYDFGGGGGGSGGWGGNGGFGQGEVNNDAPQGIL